MVVSAMAWTASPDCAPSMSTCTYCVHAHWHKGSGLINSLIILCRYPLPMHSQLTGQYRSQVDCFVSECHAEHTTVLDDYQWLPHLETSLSILPGSVSLLKQGRPCIDRSSKNRQGDRTIDGWWHCVQIDVPA